MIILNHLQTRDLIEDGKAFGNGKLIGNAFAKGTAFNGMSAHAGTGPSATTTKGLTVHTGNPNPASTTSKDPVTNTTANNLGQTIKDAGQDVKDAAANTETALDKFKKWADSLFDWIEVRIERLQHSIDKSTTQSELDTKFQDKNTRLEEAQDTTETLRRDQDRGVIRYDKQAEKVRKKAIKDNILSEKEINNLVQLIQNGDIDIEEYESKKSKGSDGKETEENPTIDFITAYKEWYDKARNLELASLESRANLLELEQTQLDNITEEYDTRTGLTEARQSRLDSTKQLKIARGKDPRSKSIEANVDKQLDYQKTLRDQLNEQAQYYKQEMADAINVYGKDSNQYRQAQAQYNEILQRRNEADIKYIEMRKEYEKERLDFIQKRYETDANYAESVKATSESLTSLYRTQGKAENGNDIKSTYNNQINQQANINKILTNEMKAYEKELERAKNIYGEGSDEYKEALTTFEGMKKAVNEGSEALIQLKTDLKELDITVIGYAIDRLTHKVGQISSITDLIQKRGKRYNDPNSGVKETDFTSQIDINNDIIKRRRDRIAELREEQAGKDINSQAYRDIEDRIWADSDAIISLMSNNEDLAQQVRELRWEPFRNLSDTIDDAIGDYDHLISLMNEESFFDDFGDGYKLTIDGISAIALYGEEISANERKIALYKEGLEALNEEYHNGNISEEQWIQQQREFKGVIQSSASAIKQEREQIIALYKTQMTNEANALKKNIDGYVELLNRKKSYYDYDRQLTDKNKNIQMLERELRALEGVAGAEAAAERARLQADLYDAKRDRDDTIQEHTYSLRTEGLNDLKEDIDETLDRNLKAVEANASVQDQVVSEMLGKVLLNYNTVYQGTGGINEVIGSSGQKTTDTTLQQTTDISNMLQNSANKYETEVLKMKNTIDSLKNRNKENVDKQLVDTNSMLTETETDYKDVYKRINDLITSTGTKVGTEAETSMQKMQETITPALEKVEKGIDEWIERNKGKGFTIDTRLIATGNPSNLRGLVDPDPQNTGGGSKGGSTGSGSTGSGNTKSDADKKVAEAAAKKAEAEAAALKAAVEAQKIAEINAKKKAAEQNANKSVTPEDDILKSRQRQDNDRDSSGVKLATGVISMIGSELKTGISSAITDPVQKIINGLSNRSKSVTAAEKKSHSELWTYIATKYGKAIHSKQVVQLANALGVSLSANSKKTNSPTDKERANILKALKKKGYLGGTLGTKHDELNWTHSGEIIRMSDGAILRQLPQGTQVIPKLESQNLMRWAQLDPSKWTHEGIRMDVVKSNAGQSISPVLNYSPTINGTGLNEQQVLDLLKKDREAAFRDFTNRIRKDLKMSGR